MSKRWRRRVIVGAIGIGLLMAGFWVALPSLTVAMARRRLPLVIDRELTISNVFREVRDLPVLGIARVNVAASSGRILAIAAALEQPQSSLLLREGMCMQGEWRDARNAPELPCELVMVVRRSADPPQVAVAVPAEPLAEFIAQTTQPVAFMGNTLRWQYRLDPGSVLAHEGPPMPTATGVRRRFRATASGRVTAWLNDAVCEVRVTRLIGHIDLDADRRGDGWHVHGRADVETVESHIVTCTSPILEEMAGNLETGLEMLLNSNVLSEPARRGDVLPTWFPIDLGFQAVVAATPEDCAAAAMLP